MNVSTAKMIALLLSGLAVLFGGCRRPAYQDVYVQNMSAEIRELEDLVYEYDHEYRKLELEYEMLERENKLLKQGQDERSKRSSANSSSKSGSAASGADLLPPVVNEGEVGASEDKAWQDRDRPPTKSEKSETTPPPAERSPEKSLLESKQAKPMPAAEEEPAKPLSEATVEPLQLQPAEPPKKTTDLLPPPSTPAPKPDVDTSKKTKSLESSLLEPPAIDLGTPETAAPSLPDLPPSLPVPDLNSAPGGTEPRKIETPKTNSAPLLPPPTLGGLDVELGRITKGTRSKRNNSQPVSGINTSGNNSALQNNNVTTASFSEASPASQLPSEEPTSEPFDQRMTDIVFVRPFSVSLNLDGKPGDDAVRLVLQPCNSAGEFLSQPAELWVSAIDPTVNDDRGRLGVWKFSAADVQAAMRHSGISKGIHLDLPLEGKMPNGKKVMVFVRYQTADGRRIESSHEYILAAPGDLESKWLPRASSTNAGR